MDELLSEVEETARWRPAPARICLIIGRLGLGGAGKQVVLLAEGLRSAGVDVTVVMLTGQGPREAALRAAGVPVVHIGLQEHGGWPAVPHRCLALARLTRYLRRTRPDVVHAFLYHSGVLGALACRWARVPVVIAGRRSLDDVRRRVPTLERLATGMTHLLVADARAVAERARDAEGVPDTKLAVIYNGLPSTAFVPAPPAELPTPRPVLLCVANLERYNGQAELLDAAALLRDQGYPCTVALAGEGPERAALRRQASALRLDVRLLGARTDVDGLLARADVVVLPSHTEGLSNTVMEAMAAGRPVVATAVGGTPELLENGRGLLVPPGDPDALADAVGAVLVDSDLAELLGRNAHAWSREHLHVDAMVRAHLVLYDEMLERRCVV